jgi:hypothetical protein
MRRKGRSDRSDLAEDFCELNLESRGKFLIAEKNHLPFNKERAKLIAVVADGIAIAKIEVVDNSANCRS